MRSAIRFFPAAEGRRDRPLVAVASLCGGVFLASSLDAVAKALSGEYPVHELLFFRSAVAAPVLLVLLLRLAKLRDLSTRYWPLVALRALILSSAYIAFILSVATLQLADGVAIYFTMPLIVAALAGPLLGERVPASRWIAIAVGFAGVLVMLKPGASVFEPAGLLALWSAIGYAIGQLIARPLTAHVRPVVIVFWQNLVFLAVAVALALLTPLIPSEGITHPSLLFLLRPWKIGPVFDMFLITSLGVLSALAMILFTEAYRLGEANFVAPFEYSAMLWAVIFGFLVWGDLPGPATAMGGAMVAGAGLFMLLAARRERLARLAGGPVEFDSTSPRCDSLSVRDRQSAASR